MKTSRSPNRVSLPRALSKLGFASRSTAHKLIGNGSVLVNGNVELNPHRWVNLQSDRITVDGNEVVKTERRYVLLNKPTGVVTTVSDERGRTTVLDVLGEEGAGLAPVGRLDKDTSGLLLLTNDNELGNILTSPGAGLPKTYAVVLDRIVRREDLAQLRKGISITVNGQEHRTLPAETRLTDRNALELTITEGKNRQVRRMFEELGYSVLTLHRVAVGPLRMGTLREGEFRSLTPEEIAQLTSWKKQKRPTGSRKVHRQGKKPFARRRQ